MSQGMDNRAERIVHNSMVEVTCKVDVAQYFLITHKIQVGYGTLEDVLRIQLDRTNLVISLSHFVSHSTLFDDLVQFSFINDIIDSQMKYAR